MDEVPKRCPHPWFTAQRIIHKGAYWSLNRWQKLLNIQTFIGWSVDLQATSPDDWEEANTLSFNEIGTFKFFVKSIVADNIQCMAFIQSIIYHVMDEYPESADDTLEQVITNNNK